MFILLRPPMVRATFLWDLTNIPMKYRGDSSIIESSDCREQCMLLALGYGVVGYDTVPASQASYEISNG